MKGYTKLNSYRYERKFVGNRFSRAAAETVVKQNSAFFLPVFHPRRVNNIYFDTPGLDCFFDNLFGIGNRWKARVRWYDNQFGRIDSPVLEFKIKKGLTGTKKSYPIPPFAIDDADFNALEWKNIFLNAQLPVDLLEKIKGMQPVIFNSYFRSYFSTANKKFRITVDDEMEYYNLRPTWNRMMHKHKEFMKTVIELKYDAEYDSKATEITNEFPFRLDKNSKFVSGMSHFKSAIAE